MKLLAEKTRTKNDGQGHDSLRGVHDASTYIAGSRRTGHQHGIGCVSEGRMPIREMHVSSTDVRTSHGS